MSSSSSHSNATFSNFQNLFDAALSAYREKTGKDVATDPLTVRLLRCDSSDAVLGILQEKAHVFYQHGNGDWNVSLSRLKSIVDILLGLSTGGDFGEGIGPVGTTKSTYNCRRSLFILQKVSAAKTIFAGIGLLLAVCIDFRPCDGSSNTQVYQAAEGVSSGHDALIDLMECFELFLGHLKTFTVIPFTLGGIIFLVKIMAELLSVLALAMQQITQGRFSEFKPTDKSHISSAWCRGIREETLRRERY